MLISLIGTLHALFSSSLSGVENVEAEPEGIGIIYQHLPLLFKLTLFMKLGCKLLINVCKHLPFKGIIFSPVAALKFLIMETISFNLIACLPT